jgi:C1A family cysteine protease
MAEHQFGYVRPSPDDERDYLFVEPPATLQLPSGDNLGPLTPHIKDQGQEGSCTGFSLSSARESLAIKAAGNIHDFSAAFLYYEERRIEHDTTEDAGANLRDGMKVLKKIGVPPEDLFPYRAGDFTAPPPPNAYDAAVAFTISAYHRLYSIRSIKAAIAIARQPVVLGITVYQGMEESRDGRIPMPGPGEQAIGGHAILCVGYVDSPNKGEDGWLILNNSWGSGAGTNGQYFLPYKYLLHTDWAEMWTMS